MSSEKIGETVHHALHLEQHRKLEEARKGFEYIATSIYKNAGSEKQAVERLGELTAAFIRDILEIKNS